MKIISQALDVNLDGNKRNRGKQDLNWNPTQMMGETEGGTLREMITPTPAF